MTHSLSERLLLYARQFEDQHAPENITMALREAAAEIDRLRAGGCARDQGTTQFCAEAAALAAENERLQDVASNVITFRHHVPYQLYEKARAALSAENNASNHRTEDRALKPQTTT